MCAFPGKAVFFDFVRLPYVFHGFRTFFPRKVNHHPTNIFVLPIPQKSATPKNSCWPRFFSVFTKRIYWWCAWVCFLPHPPARYFKENQPSAPRLCTSFGVRHGHNARKLDGHNAKKPWRGWKGGREMECQMLIDKMPVIGQLGTKLPAESVEIHQDSSNCYQGNRENELIPHCNWNHALMKFMEILDIYTQAHSDLWHLDNTKGHVGDTYGHLETPRDIYWHQGDT